MTDEEDLENELGSLPNADDIEADLNGQSEPAAHSVPTTGPGRPQPRARRRKGMSATAATTGELPPSTVTPAATAPMDEGGGDGRKDIFSVWPRVLEQQKQLGYVPEALGIAVARIAAGPAKAQAEQLAPIAGELVSGDMTTSPGEMLYDYIVDFYHLESGGPATYRLSFFYRSGGGTFRGSAELQLGHPTQVKRQREAAELRRHEQAMKAGQIPPGTPFRSGYGIPYYPPAPAAPAAAPASPGTVSLETLQEIKSLSSDAAYMRGRMEAEAAAKAATPVATPAQRDPRLPPVGLTAEEWDRIQEERQARGVGKAVVQALTAMGFTPQTLGQLTGPIAQQAVPVQPAPVTAMGALKDAIALITEVAGFQKTIGKILPEAAGIVGAGEATEKPEDDPMRMKPIPGTDMFYSEKLEDESWPDYIIRWGTHNLAASEKILAWAAKTFDPQTFQKIASAVADAVAKRGNRAPAAPPQMAAAPAPAAPAAGQEAPKFGWQPT